MTWGVWWFVVHFALMEIVAKKVAFITVLTVSSGLEKQKEFQRNIPHEVLYDIYEGHASMAVAGFNNCSSSSLI